MASDTLSAKFSGTKANFWYYIDWSSSSSGTNQSTVTFSCRFYCESAYYTFNDTAPFTLVIKDENSSGTERYNYQTKFNKTTIAVNPGCSESNKIYINKNGGVTFLSNQTFTVPHDSTGNRKLYITSTINVGASAGSVSLTSTITLDTLISACGAPANIYLGSDSSTATSGIVKPATDTSIRIHWTAGSAGNNNAITKYIVYWKKDSVPTTSSFGGTVETTNLYYNFASTISDRGSTYYFKVLTVGSQSGFNSGLSSNSCSCTINTRPQAPTIKYGSTNISNSIQTVKSTVSTYAVTATAGTDTNTGQTLSLYYSTTSGGSKTSGSNFTITPTTNGASVYFWTYDGLEYSESSTYVTVKKNVAPTLSFTSNYPSATTYTANNTSYTNAIAVKVNVNKNCTIESQIIYNVNNSTPNTTYNCSNTTVSSTSGGTIDLGTFTINQLLKNQYNNNVLKYYFKCRAVDSLGETSSWVESSTYSLAGAPSVINDWDRWATSAANPTSIITDYRKCWTDVCISYYNDKMTGMQDPIVTATVGGVQTKVKETQLYSNSGDTIRWLNVRLAEYTGSNQDVVITVELTDGNITKTFSVTRKSLTEPVLGAVTLNIGNSASTINYYESPTVKVRLNVGEITFNSQTLQPNSNNNTGYINTVNVYVNSVKADTNPARRQVTKNSISGGGGTTAEITVLTDGTTNSFYKYGDWNSISGTSTGYVLVEFTNVYGRKFYNNGSWTAYQIKYSKDPDITSIAVKYNTNGSSTWNTFPANPKLQEGLYLQFTVSCKVYLSSTVTARLYYKIGSSGNYIDTLITASDDYTVSSSTGVSGNLVLQFGPLPEITSTDDWYWRVVVTNNLSNGSTIPTNDIQYNVIKHVAPVVLSITDNPGDTYYLCLNSTSEVPRPFIYSAAVDPNNIGTNASSWHYEFFVANSQGTSISYTSTGEPTSAGQDGTTSNINNENAITNPFYDNPNGQGIAWGNKTVKIGVTTSVTGLKTTYKTGYSNTVVLSVAQPTLAYRRNHLGINTGAPRDYAVLDIYQHGSYQYINLNGENYILQIDLANQMIDIIDTPV